MSKLIKLFFVLRGDNPTLPISEIKAIAESEGLPMFLRDSPSMIQRCSASGNAWRIIAERSYYTRYILEELIHIKSSEKALSSILDLNFREIIHGGKFRVSMRSLKGATDKKFIKNIRAESIKIIKEKTGSEHVLLHPDIWLMGFFSEDWFLFGSLLSKSRIRPEMRRPHQRPYFHPSSLQPKLAGCMVNLSRINRGETFLDPFCGAGSLLLEAALMGFTAIGSDLSKYMAEGAKRNIVHYKTGDGSVVIGDARIPPFLPVDSIATDPPYGRTTSVDDENLEALYIEFLYASKEILKSGGYICIAAPDYIELANLAEEVGFKHLESHFIRVHGSLTREIAVLRM